MAAVALAAQSGGLPRLREEIALYPGPTAPDGSPTWTLHDPVRNQFYRLGWREFEILSRWDAGDTEALIERLDAETTLEVEPDEVKDVARFLFLHSLVGSWTPEGTKALAAKAERLKLHWAMWLLKNYLFLRIRLVRPNRLLDALYPRIAWVYTPVFRRIMVAVAALALYLVARRWDEFRDTISYLFSIEGAIYFALTLTGMKVMHELGHALTAKRYGCRVPAMGVVMIVLWPVPYTDVTESWKLASRRQRMAVGVAGVTAELIFAVLATLAWSFLPDGPMRSAMFLVATSTWITTLLINLSPFMRYDGYFVLSDWLEMPNLHHRAFALARWWMRERLFKLGEPPPEDFPPGRRRFLVAFAFLTWAYRFSIFLGIATLVYHFTIKFVGIAMMVVELGYFLVRPVWMEAHALWRLRDKLRWGLRPLLTLTGAALVVLALILPWRSAVEAPAVLKSADQETVFAPEEGTQVGAILASDGAAVAKDAPVVELASPDLVHKLDGARGDLAILEWQLSAQGLAPDLLARSRVAEQEYGQALAAYRAFGDEIARLHVIAPIAGRIVDIDPDLRPGQWLPPHARLMAVIDPRHALLEAYVYEADLARIAVGTAATFYPDGDWSPPLAARVSEIDRANARILAEPYLASRFGGEIPVREPRQNEWVPEKTVYRVVLTPLGADAAPARVLRGRVVLSGAAESLALRAWRAFLAVAVRESGA